MPQNIDSIDRESLLESIYDDYASVMYRMALSLTGSSDLAEDVVQEVFLSFASRLDFIEQIKNIKSYLLTAIRNTSWRHKSKWKHKPLIENSPDYASAQEIKDMEIYEKLETVMGWLSEEQRQIVLLKIDGELTFKEIAEVTGVGLSTVASRYRYAMEKLQKWMNP